MLNFLRTLRDGNAVEKALQQVYGFDIEGFEDAWRAAIGAQPRTGSVAKPTATLVPTVVPTFAPASIPATGPTSVPTRERPTPTPIVIVQAAGETTASVGSAAIPSADVNQSSGWPIIATGLLAFGIIVIVIIFFISRRKQRINV
jgi:hypothetical protein